MSRDFRSEGFLAQSPGREFQVQGHDADNQSGLLAIGVLVVRDRSDDVLTLGRKHGLKLFPEFDDAEPSLVLLEAIGEVNFVEHFAKDLTAHGFCRLDTRI